MATQSTMPMSKSHSTMSGEHCNKKDMAKHSMKSSKHSMMGNNTMTQGNSMHHTMGMSKDQGMNKTSNMANSDQMPMHSSSMHSKDMNGMGGH